MSWPEGGLRDTIMGMITRLFYGCVIIDGCFLRSPHRKVDSVGIIFPREERTGGWGAAQ